MEKVLELRGCTGHMRESLDKHNKLACVCRMEWKTFLVTDGKVCLEAQLFGS